MERKYEIIKISITKEALFDFWCDTKQKGFNNKQVKRDLEEYMQYMKESGKLENASYFRLKYQSEEMETMYMFFLVKGKQFRLMQTWWIVGVCKESDYDNDLEDMGQIRNWLTTPIHGLKNEEDWVKLSREKEKEQEEFKYIRFFTPVKEKKSETRRYYE
ncbi:MAG: hypothetical protein R3Y65_00590 [Bacillota bacterium]